MLCGHAHSTDLINCALAARREGVDVSLVRERLRLTPTERTLANERALVLVEEVRRAGEAYRAAAEKSR